MPRRWLTPCPRITRCCATQWAAMAVSDRWSRVKVVRLAAEGLTNPEIGEKMFIARGTVKMHLSHIYAKLDVRNRSELASLVTRREPR
jgi:DNA-binding NarL/FixJ family response regulator